MVASDEELIERLSRNPVPVRRVGIGRIIGLQLLAAALAVGLAGLAIGLRPDLLSGHPVAQLLAREAILLLAALAFFIGANREAFPAAWTPAPLLAGLAMVALLPGLAGLSLAQPGESAPAFAELPDMGRCLALAAAFAVPSLLLQVWWVRSRGTITAPRRAAASIGLAAGATGMAVYGLTCPSLHWLYAGTAYPLAIACVAGLASLALPALLRW